LAIALRLTLLSHQTSDFRDFLQPWYKYIGNHGGFWALGDGFSNYAPLYLYGLVIVQGLLPWVSPVMAIKLITFPFEGLTTFWLYRSGQWRWRSRNPEFPRLLALTFLFSPTLVLNGSYWGQSDIIYTTGLVSCLWALIRQCPHLGLMIFGLAIAVKLQAIWLFPALLIWAGYGKIPWRAFGWVPLVYCMTCLPAAIAGRPWPELLTIYFQQANSYPFLTLNAPNLYQWLPNELFGTLYPGVLFLAIAVIGVFIGTGIRRKFTPTPPTLIQLSLISVVLVPFILPKMHERYFLAADVLSFLYVGYFPQQFWVAPAINLISLFSYFPFLVGVEIIPLKFLALCLGAIVIFLWTALDRSESISNS
jgi:Gpi18-like mannosyltransferase